MAASGWPFDIRLLSIKRCSSRFHKQELFSFTLDHYLVSEERTQDSSLHYYAWIRDLRWRDKVNIWGESKLDK